MAVALEIEEMEEYPLNQKTGDIIAQFVGSYPDRFHNLFCCFVSEDGKPFRTHTLWGNQNAPTEAGPSFKSVEPGTWWRLFMMDSMSPFPKFSQAHPVSIADAAEKQSA